MKYARGIFTALTICGLTACTGDKNSEQTQKLESTTQTAVTADTNTAATISTAIVANPSNFDRVDESLYFSFYNLGLDPATSPKLGASSGNIALPTQIVDADYDGVSDGVIVLLDLAAGESKTVNLVSGTSDEFTMPTRTFAEISTKVGGQWQAHSKYPDTDYREYVGGEFVSQATVTPPSTYTDHSNWIRYEGPGIESDKVGYRVYLDWRNGFDIFGKLTDQSVLSRIGQDGYDSYHQMQPWGMDILKVGSSLGAGGFGLWQDEKIQLISDTQSRSARILAGGPLMSAFAIDYRGWSGAGEAQDLTANFSMSAGSRLVKTSLNLSKPVAEMVAGIVKHDDTEFIQGSTDITGKAYTYIASWGQQSLNGDYLGMAVFFKKDNLVAISEDESNYFAVLAPRGKPHAQQLEYYFAAAWQPESGFSQREQFVRWLEQQVERLTVSPRIRLSTAATDSALAQFKSNPVSLAVALGDSELARKTLDYGYHGWDINRQRAPKFEYDTAGLVPFAYTRLADVTGRADFAKVAEQVTGSFVSAQGDIARYQKTNYNIDSILPGRNLLHLYRSTQAEHYRLAAQLLREQLHEHPKTSEGAFWHKQRYPHQLWLDGVYMGMPFLAEYSVLLENGESLAEVVNEFELTRKYLRDPQTGLYYHAWDEAKQQLWADPTTGLSEHFWARGIGWFAMAVVDVLAIIPKEQEQLREPLLEIAQELAVSLASVQDNATGAWWQILDKPDATGNYLESSASAMFVYFYATALANGYIDSEFDAVASKGYEGLVSEFLLVHHDGGVSMTNQCLVAGLGFGRDGSYRYYMSEPVWQNDPKGTGPLILAALAVAAWRDK